MDKFIQDGKVVHEQAVAEMAVFEVAVSANKVKVDVQDRFQITLSCPGRLSCPIVLVNAARSNCMSCSDCIYGDHFQEYWKLTGKGFGGGAIPRRECGVKRTLDLQEPRPQSLDVRQRILCPDYDVVGGALLEPDREQRDSAKSCPEEEFSDTEMAADFTRPTRRALNSTLITIGDRIICPMAVIQP